MSNVKYEREDKRDVKREVKRVVKRDVKQMRRCHIPVVLPGPSPYGTITKIPNEI